MAFYGRVTNEAKTSMTFDKVYPNRLTAKIMAKSDGVFVGRFVLVEYDNKPYTAEEHEEEYTAIKQYFEGGIAATEYDNLITNLDESNYNIINYQIDKLEWPKLGKGFDGTVLRKVISDSGDADYVVLAELNSVVPTFDVTAEAPSNTPIQPYFDKDSSNVYYNLHMGTPWGFQLGNIDLHASGFDKDSRPNYPDSDGYNNEIIVEEVASNQEYGTDKKHKNDIKKLVIKLPVLGVIVQKIWDYIYGVSKDNPNVRNEAPSFTDSTGNRPAIRNTARMVQDDGTYTPEEMESITGALNSLYDLIGMNVYKISDEYDETMSDDNAIYYNIDDGQFYYKNYEYEPVPLDEERLSDALNLGVDKQEFLGELLDPTGLELFTKPADSEHYYAVPDSDIKPDMACYTLKAAELTTLKDPDNAEEDDSSESLIELAKKGYLYAKEPDEFISGSDNYIQVVVAEERNEEILIPGNVDYYIIRPETPEFNGNIIPQGAKIYQPGSLLPLATLESNGTIGDYDINRYPEGKVIYEKSQQEKIHPIDPDTGRPDETKWIYTTEIHAIAKTINTSDQVPDATSVNTIVYPWPEETILWKREIVTRPATNDVERVFWRRQTGPQSFPSVGEWLSTPVELYELEPSEAQAAREWDTKYWGVVADIDNGENVLKEIYRKQEADTNPTYVLDTTYVNGAKVPLENIGPIFGVNGLDGDDGDGKTYYFIPNELYNEDGTLASAYVENATYYKINNIVVISDPLGEFNEGELWNPELDIDEINSTREEGDEVVLGIMAAKPRLYPLEGYARDKNSINGWLIALNKLIGNADNRDKNTIKGLLSHINDRLDKIEYTGANKLIISDNNGHLKGAEDADLVTDGWINASTTSNGTGPVLTLEHTSFFDTASIPTFGVTTSGDNVEFTFPIIDEKGHVIGATTATSGAGGSSFALPSAFGAISTDSGTITASGSQATVSILGDSWISTTATSSGITISHTAAMQDVFDTKLDAVVGDYGISHGGTYADPSLAGDEIWVGFYDSESESVITPRIGVDHGNIALESTSNIGITIGDLTGINIYSDEQINMDGTVLINGESPLNVIEAVKVNGSALSVSDKTVNITMPITTATTTGSDGPTTRLQVTIDSVNYDIPICDSGLGTVKPHLLPLATDSTPGAVVVDNTISALSSNPIQNAAVKAYVDEQITNMFNTLGFRVNAYNYTDDGQSGGGDYQPHDTGTFTLTGPRINGYAPVRVVTASIDDDIFHINSTSVAETASEVVVSINYEVLELYSTQSDPSYHATVLFEINS